MTDNFNSFSTDPELNAILNLEEQEYNGVQSATSVPYQALATQAGLDSPVESQQQTVTPEMYEEAGKPNKQGTLPYHNDEDLANYKDLSLGEKAGEIGGTLLQGAYDGLDAAAFGLLPDKKLYKPKSKGGKAVKDITKYTIAAASFLIPVGWGGKAVMGVGGSIKAAGAAKGINALTKTGQGLEKTGNFLQGNKVFKGNWKGVNLANAIVDPRNLVAGGLADYFAYDPEEGHIADIIEHYAPKLSNPLTDYLQSDGDDSLAEARFKNVVEGIFLAPFGGAIGHGVGNIAENVVKNAKGTKALLKANTPEEATKAAGEILDANKALDKTSESIDMLNNAIDAINKSAEEGIDPQATIRENLPVEKYAEADELINNLRKGENVGIQPDGTLAITVNNWEDAYKVTRHQMRGQSKTAIEDMNKYLDDRWASYRDEAGNLNVETLVKDYKTKWEIPEDVNIKVQYVEPTAKDLRGREGVTINRGKNNNNITIKISKDSPNQYAVLRSELEHARDYAFGQKPKDPNKHFSRYDVKNESEFASDYLYKKSVSTAIRENKNIKSNILDEYNNFNKPVKPKQLGLFEQELDVITKSAETVEVKETQIKESLSKHIPDTVDELDALKQSVYSTVSRDWKTFTESADDLYDSVLKNAEALDLDIESVRAKLPLMTPEQVLKTNDAFLASAKTAGMLQDEVIKASRILETNPNDVEAIIKIDKLQNILFTMSKDDMDWGSALGTALQERRLSNRVLAEYKEIGLTDLEKDGIEQLADFLTKEYFKVDKSYFTTDDFVRNVLPQLEGIQGFKADRLVEFTNYVHKNLPQDLDNVSQIKWAKQVFTAFGSADFNAKYAKAADLAIHEKGWAAFRKYAFNNLRTTQVNGLLSSPATHVVNGLSGVVNMLLNPATKLTAGILFNNVTLKNEASDMMVGYLRAWKESAELAHKVWKSGDAYDSSADLQKFARFKGENALSPESFGVTAGQPMYHFLEGTGKALQFPMKIMGTMDTFMTQMSYRSLAFADALKTARNTLGETADSKTLLNHAEDLFKNKYFEKDGEATNAALLYEAKKMLYQNNLDGTMKIGNRKRSIIDQDLSIAQKAGNTLNKAAQQMPFMRLFLPFINTPFNMLHQAMDYSPLAIKRTLNKALTTEEKQIAMAKIGIGCTMWGLGMIAAMNGNITGTTPQGKVGEALLKTGWQPNSFVFTNPDGTKTYISYARFEPLASMLSMGADLMSVAEAMGNNDADVLVDRILGSIAQNFTEKVYFKTALNQMNLLFIDDSNSFKKAENVLAKWMQGFIPYNAAMKWADGVIDKELVQARGYLETLKRGLPFVDGIGNPIEPKRNVYGEAMYSQDNILAKLMGVRTNHQSATVEDLELIRMAEQGYSPPRINPEFKDKEMNLLEYRNPETKQTAYDAVAQTMSEITVGGKTLREALAELIESPEYENMVDGVNEREDQANLSKRKALNDVFNTYRKEAQAVVLQSDEFINLKGQTLNEALTGWQASKNMTFMSLQDESDDESYSDLNDDLGSLFY